jgi:prepilin-type N-terminal cleavage/methylation domain-containing protein
MILETGSSKQAFTPLEMIKNRSLRNKSLTGFTLIELLCVIVIIGILFTLSVPALSKTALNFQLRNKAAQIKALCEFLKKTSISEDKTYKLTIDFSENSFSVSRQIEDPEIFQTAKDSLLSPRQLPESMSFSSIDTASDTLEIVFSSSGTISSSKLIIEDRNNNSVRLITTLSGQIYLENT